MRDRAQLLTIIASQADLVEHLVSLIDQPLYLLLHPAKRMDVRESSMTAVRAAHRVAFEERATS